MCKKLRSTNKKRSIRESELYIDTARKGEKGTEFMRYNKGATKEPYRPIFCSHPQKGDRAEFEMKL